MRGSSLFFGLVGLAACGGGGTAPVPPPPPPPAAVAGVSVAPDAATLVPLQTQVLVATPKDAAGNALSGRTVTWSSGATAIATVDGNGLVSAVAPGAAAITALSEGKSGVASITVREGSQIGSTGGQATGSSGNIVVIVPAGALSSNTPISITPVANPPADPNLVPGTAYDLGPNGTQFALAVTIKIKYAAAQVGARLPANFRIHRYNGTAWVPLPGSTVDVGTLTVTGQTSSFSLYAIVQLPPVATITLSPNPVDLPLGMQVQLTPTLQDAQGNPLTGRTVAWNSTVTTVASVSQTGLVSSGSIGATVISATSEGITRQMTLNVRSDPSARTLSLNQTSANIFVPGRGLVVIPAVETSGCVIAQDQRGYCFGRNSYGELGDGSLLDRGVPTPIALNASLVAVAKGGLFGCALDTNHQVWCWGDNPNGEFGNGAADAGSPTPVRAAGGRLFVDLVAGYEYACGIDTNGGTYCWGLNLGGLLGTGSTTPDFIPIPTRVANDPGFVSLSAGSLGTCGLTVGGTLYCWGTAGATSAFSAPPAGPRLISTTPAFARVSVGTAHACALAMDRRLFCFGANFSAQLGDGTTTDRSTPTLVSGGMTWRFVSAGLAHTCAVTTDNRNFCWGNAGEGETGNGTINGSFVPVELSGSPGPFAVVRAGQGVSCGLTVEGAGYCWGTRGALGDGDFFYSAGPRRVSGAQNAQDVARGRPLGCYINTTKQLACWAETEDKTSAQTPSFGTLVVKAAAAASGFACVILDSNSRISCWGSNGSGQLGNGGTTNASAPTAVNSTRSFTSIGLGQDGACAVSTLKELLCWGQGNPPITSPTQTLAGINFLSAWGADFGNVCGISEPGPAYCGAAPQPGSIIAVPNPATQHWVMMAPGKSDFFTAYTCGLTDTGVAYCMGDNRLGQLGDGTTTDHSSMAPVSGGLLFTQIVTATGAVCALTASGAVYCWGGGADGRLGRAPGISSSVPLLLPGGLHFTRLAASMDGFCGVTSDGSVYCWGTRANSSLGDGELDDRRTPVPMAGGLRILLYEPGTVNLMALRRQQP